MLGHLVQCAAAAAANVHYLDPGLHGLHQTRRERKDHVHRYGQHRLAAILCHHRVEAGKFLVGHAADIPYTLSGLSTTRLEDVAQVAPQHARYQLYGARERRICEDLKSAGA